MKNSGINLRLTDFVEESVYYGGNRVFTLPALVMRHLTKTPEGTPPFILAKILGKSRQQINFCIRNLEKKGLIQVKIAGKPKFYELTEKGKVNTLEQGVAQVNTTTQKVVTILEPHHCKFRFVIRRGNLVEIRKLAGKVHVNGVQCYFYLTSGSGVITVNKTCVVFAFNKGFLKGKKKIIDFVNDAKLIVEDEVRGWARNFPDLELGVCEPLLPRHWVLSPSLSKPLLAVVPVLADKSDMGCVEVHSDEKAKEIEKLIEGVFSKELVEMRGALREVISVNTLLAQEVARLSGLCVDLCLKVQGKV